MLENFDKIKKEIVFKTSRSGGAGGQNVNKVETKVALLWNIQNSSLFTEQDKVTLKLKLSNRISIEGFLIVESSDSRSQLANKENALAKLYNLITGALKPNKKRMVTKIPRSKILERLDRKNKLSEKKSNRRWRLD